MNAPSPDYALIPIEAALKAVASRLQLSKTKHAVAERNLTALCDFLDRAESPLKGKIIRCYPSGSFATGTAIAGLLAHDQHDVDGVAEVDVSPHASPEALLHMFFAALNGSVGSKYHGRVKLNSRCVTVTYDDKTTVDLMPIARLASEPDRAGNLFHFKPETNEQYHKPVNPWAFSERFNSETDVMTEFAKSFDGDLIEKAELEDFPDHVPLSAKSTRVVAIQLGKRQRDIAFQSRKGRREPPSAVIVALSLEKGPPAPLLIDELIALVTYMAERINAATFKGERLCVCNPAYPRDLFTDRWPEDIAAQKLYLGDLRTFRNALLRLRNDNLSPSQVRAELEQLFGEDVAVMAVEAYLAKRSREASAGELRFGNAGRVLTGVSASAAVSTRARASTFEGGTALPK